MKNLSVLGILSLFFSAQVSYGCETHVGDLVIFSAADLVKAQKYCIVTGSLDYLQFGDPQDLVFENLVSVGKYLSFSGNTLRSLDLPKLEMVGWWMHVSSKSYHQQHLEWASFPLLKSGTVMAAVTPNLTEWIYDPCSPLVFDEDSLANLEDLGLARACAN